MDKNKLPTSYSCFVGKLTKMKIVTLFHSGKYNAEEISQKLDEILDDVYLDGVEMGLCESLNYVINGRDRDKIFDAIGEMQERRDNEC